jgi:hypothetical protein
MYYVDIYIYTTKDSLHFLFSARCEYEAALGSCRAVQPATRATGATEVPHSAGAAAEAAGAGVEAAPPPVPL